MSHARRLYFLSFLTGATVLAAQVLVHRVVSAKFLNNYAFMAISVTMLGFAAAGAYLAHARVKLSERLDRSLLLGSLGFAVSLIGAIAIFYAARTDGYMQAFTTRMGFMLSLLKTAPMALLFTVPFFFAGGVLGLLLSQPGLSKPRLYSADLLGSCTGAALTLGGISLLGVENCTLLVAAAQALGAWSTTGYRSNRTRLALVATLAFLASAAFFPRALLRFHYPDGTMLGKGGFAQVEHTQWDPVTRVEVSRILRPYNPRTYNYPSLIGGDPTLLSNLKLLLTQNNFAFTHALAYDGDPASLKGISQTIYAAAYEASVVSRPKVAVIGVGGGFDLHTALRYEASSVTGIDVNAATLDVLQNRYRDYFRALVEDPRVKLVHDDGRHYLARSNERFDVLQLSGVDTYASTAGAAHVFSESYLYTRQAMRLYLEKLTDQGILNLMRLEWYPEREMLRALVTAMDALQELGVEDPAKNIVMVSSANVNFTAMLVKRQPFTPDELKRIEEWAFQNPYVTITGWPGEGIPRGYLRTAYAPLLAEKDPVERERMVNGYVFDITAVDDARPFFFHFTRWSHFFSKLPEVQATIPFLEITTLVLIVLIALAALLTIGLPLAKLKRMRRSVAASTFPRYGVVFAATAVGFLAIEMALLQKFGLLLGHPNYAVSVVLAALLASSGAGALLSPRIVATLRGVRNVAYTLAFGVFGLYFLAFPAMQGWIGLPFPVLVTITCLLIAPVGILAGVFVPHTLERMERDAPEYIPWAWGINGIFSVLAPVLAIAFSVSWGIHALLLAAIPIYLVAAIAMPKTQSLGAHP